MDSRSGFYVTTVLLMHLYASDVNQVNSPCGWRVVCPVVGPPYQGMMKWLSCGVVVFFLRKK
jgi:hypothetical protein